MLSQPKLLDTIKALCEMLSKYGQQLNVMKSLD
jgi:hypothetical protein